MRMPASLKRRAGCRSATRPLRPDPVSLTPGRHGGFDAGHFREEPGAGKPPARICEGEAEWPSYSTATDIHTRNKRHEMLSAFSANALFVWHDAYLEFACFADEDMNDPMTSAIDAEDVHAAQDA